MFGEFLVMFGVHDVFCMQFISLKLHLIGFPIFLTNLVLNWLF